MDSSDRKARIAITIAFIGAALLFWHTFQVFPSFATTELRDPIPAGEIVRGFKIQQLVAPPRGSQSISDARRDTCFGLRLATYRRKNSGTFTVRWAQGDHREQWPVAASELVDNAVRYFCPEQGMRADAPFTVSINGENGVSGSAATVWLTRDTSLGLVEGRPDGRALALRVSRKVRVTAHTIARAQHHAFLVSWSATLLIGLVALMALGSTRRRQ
jgi:hypothetical protein